MPIDESQGRLVPEPRVFFVATAHKSYREKTFPPGSVVIDPWRMIPDQEGVTVERLGENKPELISILCPSRDRPNDFWRMVSTISRTSTYDRYIEVVCWLDDDEPRRDQYPKPNGRLTYVEGPRQLLSKCWNDCAAVAKGNILMHCGDDITFETRGWDSMVRAEFDNCEDKILFVHGDDKGPHGQTFGTHGFIHRRWMETLGYFVPPLFSSDWNDVWLNDVANALDRRKLLPFVTEHHHYSFHKSEYDQTHKDREERGARDDVVALYKRTAPERKVDIKKLKAVMA